MILLNGYKLKRRLKKGKGCYVLYPRVEKGLIELLGDDWFKNPFEGRSLIRANNFKKFYLENGRIPRRILAGKSKEYKDKATERQKEEDINAEWFHAIKDTQKNRGHRVLYPSVGKILIELLGEDWYK